MLMMLDSLKGNDVQAGSRLLEVKLVVRTVRHHSNLGKINTITQTCGTFDVPFPFLHYYPRAIWITKRAELSTINGLVANRDYKARSWHENRPRNKPLAVNLGAAVFWRSSLPVVLVTGLYLLSNDPEPPTPVPEVSKPNLSQNQRK